VDLTCFLPSVQSRGRIANGRAVVRSEVVLARGDPHLNKTKGRSGMKIMFAVVNACSGSLFAPSMLTNEDMVIRVFVYHELDISASQCLLCAHRVLVCQMPLHNISANFHVTMGVFTEASLGLHQIVVHNS
jgi:hypothetical protein